MAEIATLARPYANAVFELARSNDRLDKWSRMLGLLSATVQTREAQALIGSPALPSTAKAHRLTDVVRDELDAGGRRFVLVLADNKRLELLPEIAAQFEERKAEAEQVLDVEITAAVALSEAQVQDYVQALERRFNQQVNRHGNRRTRSGRRCGGPRRRYGDRRLCAGSPHAPRRSAPARLNRHSRHNGHNGRELSKCSN